MFEESLRHSHIHSNKLEWKFLLLLSFLWRLPGHC